MAAKYLRDDRDSAKKADEILKFLLGDAHETLEERDAKFKAHRAWLKSPERNAQVNEAIDAHVKQDGVTEPKVYPTPPAPIRSPHVETVKPPRQRIKGKFTKHVVGYTCKPKVVKTKDFKYVTTVIESFIGSQIQTVVTEIHTIKGLVKKTVQTLKNKVLVKEVSFVYDVLETSSKIGKLLARVTKACNNKLSEIKTTIPFFWDRSKMLTRYKNESSFVAKPITIEWPSIFNSC